LVTHRKNKRLDPDDCISVAYEGLVEAALRFDEARGVKFWTFAQRRIDGALIDFMRKHDQLCGTRRVDTVTVGLDDVGREPEDEREKPAMDVRPLELAIRFLSVQSRTLIMAWATTAPHERIDEAMESLGMSRERFWWHRRLIIAHLRRVLISRGITKVSDCL
jgi:Sigma-70 region 2